MNRYECGAPTTMPKRGAQLWKGNVAVRDVQIEHHGLLIHPREPIEKKTRLNTVSSHSAAANMSAFHMSPENAARIFLKTQPVRNTS